MKRFLFALLVLSCIAVPSFAQSPPAAPLPSFFVLSGTATRDAETHRTVGNLAMGFGKDVTPNQRVFAVTTFWSTSTTSGGSGGAGYEYVPWESAKHTRIVLHGDGEATVGGTNALASAVGVGGIGYEWERSGIRGALFLNSVTPINPGPDGSQLRSLGLNLRLAFLSK